MHPVLQEVYQSYRGPLADKPAEWCQRHPGQDERRWSAQDLIQHLVLVCRSTTRLLETRLQRGRPAQGHGSVVQRLLQVVVLVFGHMPRGTPAPPFARPGQLHWPAMKGEELLEILRQEIEQMDQLLDACRKRFGIQRAATHFLLGPMRVDQWRRFHAVHFRHHLRQMQRIEKAIGSVEATHLTELEQHRS
ncbi:MAG: DinB family protein [Acidobacteriaceae bacterium]